MTSQGQHFNLRWNDYNTSLISAFETLRADDDFVDLTLGCEGEKFKAHKMLLSACSPYFKELLRGNPCQHPIIIIRETKSEDLAAILQFVYQGEVSVEEKQLDSFLKAAIALKIRGLTDINPEGSGGNVKADPSPPPSPIVVPSHPLLHNVSLNASLNAKNVSVAQIADDDDDDDSSPTVIAELDTGRGRASSPKKRKASKSPSMKAKKHGSKVKKDEDEGEMHPIDFLDGGGGADDNDVTNDSLPHYIGDTLEPEACVEEGALQAYEGTDDPPMAEDGSLMCRICGKTLRTRNSLLDHVKVHAGQTLCPICGRVFSTSGNMKRHKEKVHPTQC